MSVTCFRVRLLKGAVCTMSKDAVDKLGLTGDPVGWIEKDGKQADFPTHETENVYIGDVVDVHVEVHINPCYSWSACLSV